MSRPPQLRRRSRHLQEVATLPASARYIGRPPHAVFVETAGARRPLAHRVRHSPGGFAWGYEGSGPADLARSILWDALDREPEPWLYQDFKRDYVAGWLTDQPWVLERDDVLDYVLDREEDRHGPDRQATERPT